MQRKQKEDGRTEAVMATRVSPELFEELSAALPELKYYETPRKLIDSPTVRLMISSSSGIAALESPDGRPTRAGKLAVVCAGTSDLPVAEEAALTAELAGYEVTRLADVGVAGIHRLLDNISVIEDADVVVCVAGMDGGE